MLLLRFLAILIVLLPGFFASIALVSAGESVAAQDLKSNEIQWKASLYGLSADDTFSSSKIVGAKGLLKIHRTFSDSFYVNFRGGAQLETGSSTALFTDEFAPASKLLLEEATFNWRVINPLKLEAGAIDQSHHQNNLLVDGGAFPAALGAINFENTNYKFHADTQGAIPTGKNLKSKSTGKEPTPFLFTQKLIFTYGTEENYINVRGSRFAFQNLNRQVAQDSRFYGNSVSGIGAASSFIYKYSGYETGINYQLKLTKNFFWNGGASYLYNEKSSKNHNVGLHSFIAFSWKNEDFSLSPQGDLYKNESDSAPAYYTSSEFGHNNRKGYGTSLKLSLVKTKLDFELKYRSGTLIERNAFQKNKFDFLQLTIGLPYESI